MSSRLWNLVSGFIPLQKGRDILFLHPRTRTFPCVDPANKKLVKNLCRTYCIAKQNLQAFRLRKFAPHSHYFAWRWPSGVRFYIFFTTIYNSRQLRRSDFTVQWWLLFEGLIYCTVLSGNEIKLYIVYQSCMGAPPFSRYHRANEQD